MRWPRWFIRPSLIAGRTIHRNAHVPKYGWLVQHLESDNERIVRKAMESLGSREHDDSWAVREASVSAIQARTARFTPLKVSLARSTVRHALRGLAAKHIIQPWSFTANAPVPRRHRGDGRWKTSWRILSWSQTLEAIAVDPEVWTPRRRAFFVVGVGRKLVSPEQAAAWKLNIEAAESNPRAYAGGSPERPEGATGEERAPKPANSRASADLIRGARRYASRTASPAEVNEFAERCRAEAAKYDVTLTDAQILEILARAEQRGGRVKRFSSYLGDTEGFARLYLGDLIAKRSA
jgi:hypothetical protein